MHRLLNALRSAILVERLLDGGISAETAACLDANRCNSIDFLNTDE